VADSTAHERHSKILACLALVSLSLAACGDDDDDGASGAEACAHAQALCDGEQDGATIEVDCDELDSAPASARDCISKADECGEVVACLLAAQG
jgi:hypothetical protein